MRLLSRKFMVYVIGVSMASALTWYGKLEGQWFTSIIVLLSIAYVFMEGVIDIKQVKINSSIFQFEGKEKPSTTVKEEIEEKEENAN
jgi:hypothetical protein